MSELVNQCITTYFRGWAYMYSHVFTHQMEDSVIYLLRYDTLTNDNMKGTCVNMHLLLNSYPKVNYNTQENICI